METAKVRVKLGEHEFEAEGTPESVQAQFETFQQLLSTLANKIPEPIVQHADQTIDSEDNIKDKSHVPLTKIMHVAGRIVSLTAMPSSTENAALLIMLGHKDLRNNESVTGQEIGDGLAQSGRPVLRTDRVMDKAINDALVLKSGYKRSTRYRLSNSGHQKALAIARELIATLP
jgi:hypothetical protein